MKNKKDIKNLDTLRRKVKYVKSQQPSRAKVINVLRNSVFIMIFVFLGCSVFLRAESARIGRESQDIATMLNKEMVLQESLNNELIKTKQNLSESYSAEAIGMGDVDVIRIKPSSNNQQEESVDNSANTSSSSDLSELNPETTQVEE